MLPSKKDQTNVTAFARQGVIRYARGVRSCPRSALIENDTNKAVSASPMQHCFPYPLMFIFSSSGRIPDRFRSYTLWLTGLISDQGSVKHQWESSTANWSHSFGMNFAFSVAAIVAYRRVCLPTA
jgi:hypothetical protein